MAEVARRMLAAGNSYPDFGSRLARRLGWYQKKNAITMAAPSRSRDTVNNSVGGPAGMLRNKVSGLGLPI